LLTHEEVVRARREAEARAAREAEARAAAERRLAELDAEVRRLRAASHAQEPGDATPQ